MTNDKSHIKRQKPYQTIKAISNDIIRQQAISTTRATTKSRNKTAHHSTTPIDHIVRSFSVSGHGHLPRSSDSTLPYSARFHFVPLPRFHFARLQPHISTNPPCQRSTNRPRQPAVHSIIAIRRHRRDPKLKRHM